VQWAVLQAHQERRRGLLGENRGECNPLQESQKVDNQQEELLGRHSQLAAQIEQAPSAAPSLELLRPGLADPLDRVEVFGGNESPEIELLRLREDFC